MLRRAPEPALDTFTGIATIAVTFFTLRCLYIRMAYALRSLAVLSLGILCSSCRLGPSPGSVLKPVIHAVDQDAVQAMRSAPFIAVVEVTDAELTGDMRMVNKPPEVGGPMIPAIPLHLARIRANVLVPIRGALPAQLEFYSWIWASGK